MGRRIRDLQRDLEAARFPGYSFRNQLRILNQRPGARIVMGSRAWQNHGHQVRCGERSKGIIAPCTYEAERRSVDERDNVTADDDQTDAGQDGEGGEYTTRLLGFRIAHV